MAKFAAMCGASDAEIKRCGRWISEVYQRYVGDERHGVLNNIMDEVEERVRFGWFPVL
jgi:hypothetical protein